MDGKYSQCSHAINRVSSLFELLLHRGAKQNTNWNFMCCYQGSGLDWTAGMAYDFPTEHFNCQYTFNRLVLMISYATFLSHGLALYA